MPGRNKESQQVQKAPSLGSVLTSEDLSSRDVEFEEAADRALQERPTFSIRARLLLAFALFFVLTLVTVLWSISIMGEVQDKILFLEVADDYKVELQQARRFEKNFLLYGTDLDEAREHARRALRLTARHSERFLKTVGRRPLEMMNSQLSEYLKLLDAVGRGEREFNEDALRDHGAKMLKLARDFVIKERKLVQSMIVLARRIPFFFLAALAVLMVVVGVFLARQIIGALTRFMDYTKRIAEGDFTPITPTRKYRDEFSKLALTLNRMVRELDRHHRILTESHKLRAMGTLVAGVAHELNNPLNNIMLTASLFKDEYDSLAEDERHEMIDDVIGQSERAKKIVANLLDFARQSEAKMQPLDLSRIISETVQLVGNHLKMKKIHLAMDLPDKLPAIHGDRQLLSQVFMNLILNAVDVLPEQGKINICTSTDLRGGYLGVDITDNGPGIPEHMLSQIFDPFFTTKPTGKGTGLGLSVSRGILRKLGGYLQVESELGKGSTFTVLLPVTTVPAEISAGKAAGASPGASGE
ncbi:MAG TPA: HAMP domain-containing sensor histidine kinase [Myxococcota bacterium]|nr:HAMP domain-containing sensor histidine kinase [Myxococcota bacterium]